MVLHLFSSLDFGTESYIPLPYKIRIFFKLIINSIIDHIGQYIQKSFLRVSKIPSIFQ